MNRLSFLTKLQREYCVFTDSPGVFRLVIKAVDYILSLEKAERPAVANALLSGVLTDGDIKLLLEVE